jgi:ribosomal protein S21
MSKHYIKGNDTDRAVKSGTTVTVKNGNVERAIRRFKKNCTEEGIVQEFRDRQEFVGGAERRRKEKDAGRKRWLRKLRQMDQW